MVKTWHVISSIVLISAITVLLQVPTGTWSTSATESLIAGVISLSCMAVACILSSRWNFIEGMFGGLDRMYETHKWLGDRKSTRLNSSHVAISYAVFCLKKKNKNR